MCVLWTQNKYLLSGSHETEIRNARNYWGVALRYSTCRGVKEVEVYSEELNYNRVMSSVSSCGAGIARLYNRARPVYTYY